MNLRCCHSVVTRHWWYYFVICQSEFCRSKWRNRIWNLTMSRTVKLKRTPFSTRHWLVAIYSASAFRVARSPVFDWTLRNSGEESGWKCHSYKTNLHFHPTAHGPALPPAKDNRQSRSSFSYIIWQLDRLSRTALILPLEITRPTHNFELQVKPTLVDYTKSYHVQK